MAMTGGDPIEGHNVPAGPVAFPEPEDVLAKGWSPRGIWMLLKNFGPAAILASFVIGAGETVLAVRVGSWGEYRLLWLIAISAVTKSVFVTYLLGRYTLLTGESIGERWLRAPGPRGWLLWFILVIDVSVLPFGIAAIAAACGDLVTSIAAVGNVRLWATVFLVGAMGLGMGVTYHSLERQQLIICGILVIGTLAGAILAGPDLLKLVGGLVGFWQLPEYPPWLANHEAFSDRPVALELTTTFGYVGGTMVAYVVYADWVAVRKWGMTAHPELAAIRARAAASMPADYLPVDSQSLRLARRALLPLRTDIVLGAVALFVVTGAFLVAGASVMYPRHLLPAGFRLLSEQRVIWAEINAIMVPIYYITILAALWGSLNAIPDIFARVTHQYLGHFIGALRAKPYRWTLRRMAIYLMVASTVVVWTGIKPVTMMDILATLSTNLGVAIVCLGAIWLNAQLPPAYRAHRWVLVGTVVSALILWAVTAVSLTQMWAKYLGG